MSAFLLGWFRLIWLFTRGHQALVLENLALRQQLAVYKRHSKRPRLRRSDRMFWIVLAGPRSVERRPLDGFDTSHSRLRATYLAGDSEFRELRFEWSPRPPELTPPYRGREARSEPVYCQDQSLFDTRLPRMVKNLKHFEKAWFPVS